MVMVPNIYFLSQASSVGVKADKIRRVWEPTYVIVYKEQGEKEFSPVSSVGADENRRCSSSQSSILPQLPMLSQSQCSMDEVLQLLRQLYIISTEEVAESAAADSDEGEEAGEEHFGAQVEIYQSKKITNKLVQQIQDPLVLSADALPDWCKELSFSCPMLFPFETRLLHFHCTAFGASRWVKLVK